MTARELVTASLKLIGAIAPGESLAAQEASDALSALNRMISSWSTERLLIYARHRETPFTLSASDATVTMGSSGDITTRAQWIDSAAIQDATTSTEYPVRLLTQPEYAAIADKTLTAAYPTALFDDGGYPQRTLTLWPIPSAAHKLVLYTLRPISSVSTLDTSISLPPGYEEALIYNLAIRLAPEYGRSAPAEVVAIATEAKAGIKRANHRPSYLTINDVPASPGGSFDINTGGYR